MLQSILTAQRALLPDGFAQQFGVIPLEAFTTVAVNWSATAGPTGSFSAGTVAAASATASASASGSFAARTTDAASASGAGSCSGGFLASFTGGRVRRLQGYNDGSEAQRRRRKRDADYEAEFARRIEEAREPGVLSITSTAAAGPFIGASPFVGVISAASTHEAVAGRFVAGVARGGFSARIEAAAAAEPARFRGRTRGNFRSDVVQWATAADVQSRDRVIAEQSAQIVELTRRLDAQQRYDEVRPRGPSAREFEELRARVAAAELREDAPADYTELRARVGMLELRADQVPAKVPPVPVIIDVALARDPMAGERVGGISDEPHHDRPRRSRAKRSADYVPPPASGTARPIAIPAPQRAAPAAPDPNTPPTPFAAHGDAAPKRKPKRPVRLPRQIPPKAIEASYAKALVAVVRRVRDAYAPIKRALPRLIEDALVAKHHTDGRLDAGESGKIRRLIDAAVAASRKAVDLGEVHDLARKFAAHTATYQRMQLSRQVKSALGRDPVFRDRGLAARADQFTHENVALIKRIPERLHGDVESLITRAVAGGRLTGGTASVSAEAKKHTDKLFAEIEDRFGVSERHARLIARDQVSRFYGDLNHARQQELGITRAIWRTAGDERVRETHAALDGVEFTWDDPPDVDGEPTLPSEDIQCRCWSEPVLDDLIDQPESDDDVGEDEDQS